MSKYKYSGPETFRPLSPWAYFGYSVLFVIPIIGLISNIVLCFNSSNINRRNYARSFWCIYVLAFITVLISILFYDSTTFERYFSSIGDTAELFISL